MLWGGYGHGNVGDELTLAVAIADARRRWGGDPLVLSPNEQVTTRNFPDCSVIPRRLKRPPRSARFLLRLRAVSDRLRGLGAGRPTRYRLEDQLRSSADWVEALRSAERLYLVGGGYLTDTFPVETFLFPIEIAAAAGVPIETAPLGLGPFRGERAARRTAAALSSALLRVRDVDSLAFAARWGLEARLESDDGFRVREVLPKLALEARVASRDPSGMRPATIGICIAPQAGGGSGRRWARARREWWTTLARALSAEPGVEVRGFCFHSDPDEDLASLRRVFPAGGLDPGLVAPPAQDFREALRLLARFDVVLTARFHGAVVAAALGLPCFAVAEGEYYGSKMASVLARAPNTTRVVRPGRDDPAALAVEIAGAARCFASSPAKAPDDARPKSAFRGGGPSP